MFADNWKSTVRIAGLDLVLKNYKPVINQQYVSKLTKELSSIMVHEHMVVNGTHPVFQSAFRQDHSTETDMLLACDELTTYYMTGITRLKCSL